MYHHVIWLERCQYFARIICFHLQYRWNIARVSQTTWRHIHADRILNLECFTLFGWVRCNEWDEVAISQSLPCSVAVWRRRTITDVIMRHTRTRVATMEGITVLIWDVAVTVVEVATGPRHQLTVTLDTPTWLQSMYSSGMGVRVPICPPAWSGMGWHCHVLPPPSSPHYS
jgi:hypothetical protein